MGIEQEGKILKLSRAQAKERPKVKEAPAGNTVAQLQREVGNARVEQLVGGQARPENDDQIARQSLQNILNRPVGRSQKPATIQRDVRPGQQLPTMGDMTRQHLTSHYDLNNDQARRDTAIDQYNTQHELVNARQMIIDNQLLAEIEQAVEAPIGMAYNVRQNAAGGAWQRRIPTRRLVQNYRDLAAPILQTPGIDLTDARLDIQDGLRNTYGPDYQFYGLIHNRFLRMVREYTQQQAEAQAPEVRNAVTMTNQFLLGRANVGIQAAPNREEKQAFAQALRQMPFIQRLLNPQPEQNDQPVAQSQWQDGGALADNFEEKSDENHTAKRNKMATLPARLAEADQFIKAIVEPDLLAQIPKPRLKVHLRYAVTLGHPKGFRAYQNGTEVHVAQDEETAIIVHEVGHYLEDKLPPEVWHDIRLLIQQRHQSKGGNDRATTMALSKADRFIPGVGPLKDLKEEGRYRGGYGATGRYTSKAYSGGETEVMSMTLEYLARGSDTAKMIDKDPVQTALILRGVRPQEYGAVDVLRPFDRFLPQQGG